jgi:hypothetical protein
MVSRAAAGRAADAEERGTCPPDEEAAGKVTGSLPLLQAATARTVTSVKKARLLIPHFYRTKSWWAGQV